MNTDYNLYKIFLSNGFDISKVIKLCNSNIENAQKFLTTVTDKSGKENVISYINYNKEIAEMLDKDPKSIDNALQRIKNKMKLYI